MIRFAVYHFALRAYLLLRKLRLLGKLCSTTPFAPYLLDLQMLICYFTQKLKIYCVYYAKESVINGNECFGNCLVHHFTGGNAYGMDDDTIPSPEVSSFLLLMHNLNWFLLLLPADGYYYSW